MKLKENSKVRVIWFDRPENYSRENKNKIINDTHVKYGIPKKSINVIFKPSKKNKNGELIEIEDVQLENIMDKAYQKQLIKQYIEDNLIEIDINEIYEIDDKINSLINEDNGQNSIHRNWKIKDLWFSNFLSFGDNNNLNMSNLGGINLVTSTPSNTGGKTTLSIDVLMFLLYGLTTKTDKMEEIFNQFNGCKNLVVGGILEIDGVDFGIIRELSRSEKKAGGWNVKNEVSYYDIMPDGTKIKQEEEQSVMTGKKINERIGNVNDFELLVLATADNLAKLVDQTPGESAKFFNKFIGLEIIQTKEKLVREYFNNISKKFKSNVYDSLKLNDEIISFKNSIEENDELIVEKEKELLIKEKELKKLINEKESKLTDKVVIDSELHNLTEEKIKIKINQIIEEGTKYKNRVSEIEKLILNFGDVSFDEKEYKSLNDDLNEKNKVLSSKSTELKIGEKNLTNLKNSEFCPTCGQKMENVDHQNEVSLIESNLEKLKLEIVGLEEEVSKLEIKIKDLDVLKQKFDDKNKLEIELSIKKTEYKLSQSEWKNENNLLKKYKSNVENIERNKKIDIELEKIKTDIIVVEKYKKTLEEQIVELKSSNERNKDSIKLNEQIISEINEENIKIRNYKLYIEIFGKNGISKIVLRTVLPIINSEIHRMLDGVCNFEIELNINSKNELEKNIIYDGVVKDIKSASGLEKTVASLALRAVIGRISCLSKPNFITFDEVLGKVAEENMENIKLIFDRIKDMYDIVFLITHIEKIKDWADNVIEIEKINNISKLNLK